MASDITDIMDLMEGRENEYQRHHTQWGQNTEEQVTFRQLREDREGRVAAREHDSIKPKNSRARKSLNLQFLGSLDFIEHRKPNNKPAWNTRNTRVDGGFTKSNRKIL